MVIFDNFLLEKYIFDFGIYHPPLTLERKQNLKVKGGYKNNEFSGKLIRFLDFFGPKITVNNIFLIQF
jgi:hypothetical protein